MNTWPVACQGVAPLIGVGELPLALAPQTLPGLAQRIVQRLLALTLGIFLNSLLGRPARALAASDGR